jgi:hemolysin D
LPAALEILETPPSPLPTAVTLAICAFTALGLLWSVIGHLDVHAVAPGKIELTSRAKVIQPLEPGKVAAVAVENGSRVRAGDLLLEFDPAEVLADKLSAADSLYASLAEVARRRAAITIATSAMQSETDTSTEVLRLGAVVQQMTSDGQPLLTYDEEIPELVRSRETAVLRADLNQLADTLYSIEKSIAQKRATQDRLNMSIEYQNSLIDTLNQRVATRQESIKLRVGTKISLYDAREALQKSQASLASDKGQLIEIEAAITELASERTKLYSQFIADNEGKIASSARKADESLQALHKTQARLSRTRLTSPIDGTIQQLAVTTIGQVVTTGQQLMVVIPSSGPVQVEALVANIDVGFIRVGQDATIKVDAFPFTRFGVLSGKVTKVAPEAVDELEAKRSFANATSNSNSSPTSLQGQPQNFVFLVTLSLDQNTIDANGTQIPLSPGMTVVVEIKTDSRRVIDYLLSPLARIKSEAMKER